MPGLMLLDAPPPPPIDADDWHERAACRHHDTDLFFPGTGNTAKQVARAKLICARCPVTAQCLQEGDECSDPGIRGGLTTEERDQLRKRVGKPRLRYTHTADVPWKMLRVEDVPINVRVPGGVSCRERDAWAAMLRADGWSLREIADVLGCGTHGGVVSMVKRARAGLGNVKGER